MLKDKTASLAEVAEALGRKPEWLKRNWLRFHNEHGFPRKIPCGDVWPRGAVEAWLRSAGMIAQPLPAANENAPGHDIISAAAQSLQERYGARPQ